MRVNIYAEEMTERVEVIGKEIEGHRFTGLRIYLELPATVDGKQYQGPFMHRPGDDDSAAVTFWGKRDLRVVLRRALELLDQHYGNAPSGISQIDAERRRQVKDEGWDAAHDAGHDAGELAAAGACYALNASCVLYPHNGTPFDGPPPFWTWSPEWWKPRDPQRDLVRAGALIAAELDRMARKP